MKFKTFTALTLSTLLFFLNSSFALAVTFTDMTEEHWASVEINNLADRGVLSGYPDETFKPDNTVNRAEFIKMVIKTLDKEDLPISEEAAFSDVSSDFWAYKDIIRAKELGLINGYPDETFRPFNNITKTEAVAIISKILAEQKCKIPSPGEKPCILKQFSDSEKIADWAKYSFAKAIKNEILVNYPDKNLLTPNKDLTRAETAVLLYKLRQNPALLAESFRGQAIQDEIQRSGEEIEPTEEQAPKKLGVEDYITIVEHLPANDYTKDVTEVEINGSTAKILADNVVSVKFENGFNSKGVEKGQLVNLTFTESLITKEGTEIFPAGSQIVAEITELKKSRLFNKNGKMELKVTHLVTSPENIYSLSATIENPDVFGKKFSKENAKKIGKISGSIAAIGSTLGVVIGAIAGEVGGGSAIGGCASGGLAFLTGIFMPGCNVKVPADQEIFVKFDNDLEINLD